MSTKHIKGKIHSLFKICYVGKTFIPIHEFAEKPSCHNLGETDKRSTVRPSDDLVV